MAEKNSEELISWEDMLNYAATCRFYDSVHMAQNTKPLRPDSALAQKKDGEMSMFDYFVRVYIPEQAKASSQTTGRDADTTQDQLVMDAKKLAYANETFVRDFEEAVEANRDRVLKQFLRKHMPRFVNKEELTYVFKGLKHAHRKGEWTCQPAGFGLRGFKHFKPGYESRSFSEDCLRNWIDWKHAGALQKMESLAKSARHYKAFKGIPELRSQQEKEVLRAISQTFLLGEEETEEKGRLHKEASEALAKLKRLDDASKKFKAATAKLAGSHTSKETETLEMEIEEALKELLKELPEPKENEPRVTEEAKRKQAKKEKKRKVKAAMKAQQDQQDQHAQKPQANQHP
ncbi:hypothetical protein H2200_001331 [Cladophialophora chaetospira]|uniref:Uncharacterized protein n=1 Tax=Cladophialophora chaetospira TaxID=386627 RepID=A0AA38XKP5_9EURO|nr:hypothetical protein H2200_001331 [Cladophialophora chaetospira]